MADAETCAQRTENIPKTRLCPQFANRTRGPTELKEILATRLTSISIGAFMYLLVDERNNIYNSVASASDLIDWVRIFLFISLAFSLASISQVLWDLLSLALEMMVSWIPFGKASKGFKVYTTLYGALQGCSALYGYFLSKHGCETWKVLQEKSVECSKLWKGFIPEERECEYQILSITMELDDSICEGSSPACSKLVLFGPFLIIGGITTLIGTLVAVEYLVANDFEIPCMDKISADADNAKNDTDEEDETK